jgi:tetratricopeptide (TPR) repeat protein
MAMSSYLKNILFVFLVLGIGACQSIPKPEPQALPEPVVEATAEPVKVIDVNQQTYQAGLTALKAGETLGAIELLKQVSINAPQLDNVFTNLGLAYFKQKTYDKAEIAFQQAIKSNPEDAVAYNHLGIIKRLQGQFESARLTYQKAIQIDNKYSSAYLNLGILYDIYLQDLEQALQQYKKYQALVGDEDDSVTKWIVDIQRQLKTARTSTQG